MEIILRLWFSVGELLPDWEWPTQAKKYVRVWSTICFSLALATCIVLDLWGRGG